MFDGREWWIRALAFAPDGKTLYCWSDGKKVRMLDLATVRKVREFDAGDPRRVYHGRFSPDGNWFVCGDKGGVLELHDMVSGSLVRRIPIADMSDAYPTFAFSADSRTLAFGDDQGTIHLVEPASGKLRHHLAGGHQAAVTALVFSRDGKRLVSGSNDTTALVWDLSGRRNAKGTPLGTAELDACWSALAGEDAEAAFRSIHRMAASPTEMVAYFQTRLQPAPSVDTERMARLIGELDCEDFAQRERAFKELEQLGETATASFRRALAGKPSAEVRRRLESLLEKQQQERCWPSSRRLQELRALEALELADTRETRQLLRKLADGAADAALTREAKAALER